MMKKYHFYKYLVCICNILFIDVSLLENFFVHFQDDLIRKQKNDQLEKEMKRSKRKKKKKKVNECQVITIIYYAVLATQIERYHWITLSWACCLSGIYGISQRKGLNG